jgi:hypothetical protein|tara:strand:+ start:144 stop:653 length:510 start_codon:yes stop_codon:yes gene_type:complete
MLADWKLYSDERPTNAGVYEWRVQSKALPGLVLIVAVHMRWRGAGFERVLSPHFDYWDGYKVHVLSPVEWRETSDHADLKESGLKVVFIEGLEICPCIYCGQIPAIRGIKQYRDGGIGVNPEPWTMNSWKFECCAWGTTPWIDDPRKIERIRRQAIRTAKALNTDTTER